MGWIIDSISNFRQSFIFLSGEPYPKNYVLWFIAACLLVSVCKGGFIKIKDKQIGNLKFGARKPRIQHRQESPV